MPRGPKPQTLEAKFWKNVQKGPDCWLWIAFVNDSGFGHIKTPAGRTEKAHRVAYELSIGPIPEGKVVVHSCSNNHCVRPEHLYLAASQRFPQTKEKVSKAKTGFVYVMLNSRNGYTKIGFSKNPTVRERTLQAEDPDTQLVACFIGTTDDERTLHKRFAAKRLRGEWFNLTAEERRSIINL